MKLLLACALLVGCREQATEPPTGEPVRPPRSAAHLTPEAGITRPPSAGSQRLFADDVPTDELALSIGIETYGGVNTMLIPRGATLPVSKTEVFSTAQDNQSSVEVHVLQGERPMAVDNRSLGKFQLTGIPPAPRGVPQIEVTFAIDKDGELHVSANDRATNAKREIRIIGAPAGPIDKATVDRLIADSGKQAGDDRGRLAKQRLDRTIDSAKQALKDLDGKLSTKMRDRLAAEIAGAEAIAARVSDPGLLSATSDSLYRALHAASREASATP